MKLLSLIFGILVFFSCSTPHKTNSQLYSIASTDTIPLHITFEKGKSFHYPTFVFWIEDLEENLLHTIFITKSINTGIYGHAHIEKNVWSADSGISIRPATLPYWLHKFTNNNISMLHTQSPLLPDALSGSTPKDNFSIHTFLPSSIPQKFRILMEINQAWDWNNFWTNGKYPDNLEYKTSAQPSLIYATTVDLQSTTKTYFLNPIGHGHYAGENGLLYTDLRGHTSALQIAHAISITIKN